MKKRGNYNVETVFDKNNTSWIKALFLFATEDDSWHKVSEVIAYGVDSSTWYNDIKPRFIKENIIKQEKKLRPRNAKAYGANKLWGKALIALRDEILQTIKESPAYMYKDWSKTKKADDAMDAYGFYEAITRSDDSSTGYKKNKLLFSVPLRMYAGMNVQLKKGGYKNVIPKIRSFFKDKKKQEWLGSFLKEQLKKKGIKESHSFYKLMQEALFEVRFNTKSSIEKEFYNFVALYFFSRNVQTIKLEEVGKADK